MTRSHNTMTRPSTLLSRVLGPFLLIAMLFLLGACSSGAAPAPASSTPPAPGAATVMPSATAVAAASSAEAPSPSASTTAPSGAAATVAPSTPAAQAAACTGSISGRLHYVDSNGQPVAASQVISGTAQIELDNPNGTALETLFNPGTDFAFAGLAPGTYTLKMSPPDGFRVAPATIPVTVTCGVTVTQDITNTATLALQQAAATAAPTPTGQPADTPGLAPFVVNQPATAVYVNAAGDIYYGSPLSVDGVDNPFLGDFALWKRRADGTTIQLTNYDRNLIGGIVVYDGNIYFDEAGSLDRIPDDNRMHTAVDVVLRFPTLSQIYGHLNGALALYTFQGQPVLLMGVGSRIDSNYSSMGHPSGIQPPWYEDFPTGRIIFAKFPWLETAHNDAVLPNGTGQVYEFARGVRNPWGLAVGTVDGQTHIYAVDNDPAFRPEKYDKDPQNAGDELNDIYFGLNYGHPYYYAGEEPPPYRQPIAVFFDGSVPSGAAVVDGRVFAGLYSAGMVVQVDPSIPDRKRSWAPVLTGIYPFEMYGTGNLLYIASWKGIQVVDVRNLPPMSPGQN